MLKTETNLKKSKSCRRNKRIQTIRPSIFKIGLRLQRFLTYKISGKRINRFLTRNNNTKFSFYHPEHEEPQTYKITSRVYTINNLGDLKTAIDNMSSDIEINVANSQLKGEDMQ